MGYLKHCKQQDRGGAQHLAHVVGVVAAGLAVLVVLLVCLFGVRDRRQRLRRLVDNDAQSFPHRRLCCPWECLNELAKVKIVRARRLHRMWFFKKKNSNF